MRRSWSRMVAAAAIVSSVLVGFAFADDEHGDRDFGVWVERKLNARSEQLFGIGRPLEASAPPTTGAFRRPDQRASEQVLLARGLRVEYLTRNAGELTDMMAFFPAHRPTHLITFEEAVAIGTTLVMLSARPSRIRALLRNDGRVERARLVDDLNTMIMEEVERQQGAHPGP